MSRILAALLALFVGASFAHATNRFTFPKSATRRPAILTSKHWAYKPYIHQDQKSRRPEIRSHTTRRPKVHISLSGHKVSVEKIKSRRPLIYATDPGSQFPTPEDPK